MASWAEALARSGAVGKVGQMVGAYAENKAKEQNLYQEMVARRAEQLRQARKDEMDAKVTEINIKNAQDKAKLEADAREKRRKFIETHTAGVEVPPPEGSLLGTEPTRRPYTRSEGINKALEMDAFSGDVQDYFKETKDNASADRPAWDYNKEKIFKEGFVSNPDVIKLQKLAQEDPSKAYGVKTKLNQIGSAMGLSGQTYFESFVDNVGANFQNQTLDLQSQKFAREKLVNDYKMATDYQKQFGEELEVVSSLQDVDTAIRNAGMKDGMWNDPNEIDLPGVGIGAVFFKKYLQDKNAVELRQSTEGLAIAFRKKYFGASLTDGEQQAFRAFIGLGGTANQKSFMSALQKIALRLHKTVRPVMTEGARMILDENGILTNEDVPGHGTFMVDKPRKKMLRLSDEEFERKYGPIQPTTPPQ
jgi:hypothetical protein